MQWIRLHPYAAACALAGILLVIGTIIVERRTTADPTGLTVWGGSGAPLLNPSSYSPSELLENIDMGSGSSVSPTYIPPSQSAGAPQGAEVFDLAQLLSMLTDSGAPSASIQTSADTGIAYAFIPSGLVSSSLSSVELSEEERRLFNYGNDIGSYIQTYEDSHRGAPVTLRDQAEDRQNAAKADAVKAVAAAISRVGENILGMEEVPESVRSLHESLGESYVRAGERLAAVPDARGDEAFIAAVEAYNEAADSLAGHFVGISSLFSLSGIRFASQDPGSIFMFSGGGAQ